MIRESDVILPEKANTWRTDLKMGAEMVEDNRANHEARKRRRRVVPRLRRLSREELAKSRAGVLGRFPYLDLKSKTADEENAGSE